MNLKNEKKDNNNDNINLNNNKMNLEDKLNFYESFPFDMRLILIKPMYYSIDKFKLNCEEEKIKKIREEKFINNYDMPYPYILQKMEINDNYNTCLYFPCICNNIKNPYCISSNCKFPYSKKINLNEDRFKDGLEIMDIPSSILKNLNKKERKKINKKN